MIGGHKATGPERVNSVSESKDSRVAEYRRPKEVPSKVEGQKKSVFDNSVFYFRAY